MKRRPHAVLLDRDGTVNVKAADDDYVRSADALVLLPGAGAAVARLNAAGLPVYVVTNQRGVARGLMTLADLDAIHARLAALLAADGAHVDGVYACPHASGACDCRKPQGGLVAQVVRDHPEVDPARCVVIGDGEGDIGLARAVGAAAVRIAAQDDPAADLTASDLAAAVDAVLGWPA